MRSQNLTILGSELLFLGIKQRGPNFPSVSSNNRDQIFTIAICDLNAVCFITYLSVAFSVASECIEASRLLFILQTFILHSSEMFLILARSILPFNVCRVWEAKDH